MTITVEERELVQRYQAGNDEAFEEIVRAFTPQLLAHARRRLSDPAAAEDALQETFLRAYRALPRFNGEYRLEAWLYQILTNVCADEGGRRYREGQLLQRAGGPALGDQFEPDAATQARFPDPVVTEAFAQLPATYQEALVLRFIEELPYDEVAARSGVTEANARARVHRASAALRRTFVAVGGVLGAVVAWTTAIMRRSERLVVDGSHQASSTGEIVLNQAVTVSHTTGAASQVVAQVTNLAAQVTPTVIQAATQVAAAPEKVTLLTKVAVAAVAAVAVPVAAVSMHSATTTPAPARVEAPAVAPVKQADEGASRTVGDSATGGQASDGSGATGLAPAGGDAGTGSAPGSEPKKTGDGSAPNPAAIPGSPVTGSPAPAPSLPLRTGSITATSPLGRVLGEEIVVQGAAKISVAGTASGLDSQLTANFGIPELRSPGQSGSVRMSAVFRESSGAVFRLRGDLAGVPEGGTAGGAKTYRYTGTFEVVNGDAAALPAKGTFILRVTVPGGYLESGIGSIGSVVVDFKEVRDTAASPTSTP